MSGRGSLTLFSNLAEVSVPETTVQRKGRSAELIAQRNECLIDRYHFYLNFTDKRYTRILEELSKEFFLSTVTIPETLNDNYEALLALKNEKPTRNYFVKKWPHLIWPVKEQ